ncbi:MAG: glycosyltransferase family 25 protein [Chitinophagaceae bacterium]|nr:glycosyltransferase family 25 protein [Chitinophagaceae bacterium]
MNNQFHEINNFFDKIYIISIARATERHEKIEMHLQGLNYELFMGVDKNDLSISTLIKENIYDDILARKHHLWKQPMITGQIACAWSHKKVYEQQLTNRYNKILILEDDVIIHQIGIDLFPQMIAELPKDWELLYFDYHKRTEKNKNAWYRTMVYLLQHYAGRLNWSPAMIANLYAAPYSAHLKKAGFHEYTSAYAITLSAAEKLQKLQTPLSFIADNLLGYAITNKMINAYLSVPKLFEQESQQQGGNTYSYVTDSYDNGL